MYSAILNGIVGMHIDKRMVIGTRSANQNPEFLEFVEEFRLKRDLMNIR